MLHTWLYRWLTVSLSVTHLQVSTLRSCTAARRMDRRSSIADDGRIVAASTLTATPSRLYHGRGGVCDTRVTPRRDREGSMSMSRTVD